MEVVTLCGSMKYQDEIMKTARILSCFGYCVLTPIYGVDSNIINYNKEKFKEAHYKRIEMSDIVFICNYFGYIGESTQEEIDYAKSIDKEIIYME